MQLCLFTHSFGQVVQYSLAKERIRAFFDELRKNDDEDDFHSAHDSGDSTTYVSCEGGDELSTSDMNGFDEEFSDEIYPYACPVEEDENTEEVKNNYKNKPPPPGALIGTREPKIGCKLGFDRDYPSTCSSGPISYQLVEGTVGDGVQAALRVRHGEGHWPRETPDVEGSGR